MATLNMTETELEKLIKRAIINALTERSDLLENAVAEAILDMKLGLAIEEGIPANTLTKKRSPCERLHFFLKLSMICFKDLEALTLCHT